MNARGTTCRFLVGVMIAVLLAGCASGASSTPAPATPTDAPSSAMATSAPTATATVRPTPTVTLTRNVPYESADPQLTPDALDVYAPAKAGPWPVVVMFHGGPGSDPATDRGYLSENARRVAELGFVVFNASWGHEPREAESSWYDGQRWAQSQAACAVEFARAHATEYGGDPATMIVFGYSAGAQIGAMVPFARREPTAGCLGGATLGAIDALVTWDGEWLLQTTFMGWDEALAADPRLMDAATPWTHLAEHKDLKVVMLASEHPYGKFNPDRPLPDPKAMDAFFAPRDPSGVLRRHLEANGALTDGILDLAEAQGLLFSMLKAQGSPVSLDVLPGSTHDSLRGAGWDVFLAAFRKAARKD